MKLIHLNNIQTVIYIELILLFYESTCYKKRALKYITRGKLESLLENFTGTFDVTSYIILRKAEDSGNFTTNHGVENNLRQERFFRSSRVNKTLGYFRPRPSAPANKTETTKTEKQNLNVGM